MSGRDDRDNNGDSDGDNDHIESYRCINCVCMSMSTIHMHRRFLTIIGTSMYNVYADRLCGLRSSYNYLL